MPERVRLPLTSGSSPNHPPTFHPTTSPPHLCLQAWLKSALGTSSQPSFSGFWGQIYGLPGLPEAEEVTGTGRKLTSCLSSSISQLHGCQSEVLGNRKTPGTLGYQLKPLPSNCSHSGDHSCMKERGLRKLSFWYLSLSRSTAASAPLKDQLIILIPVAGLGEWNSVVFYKNHTQQCRGAGVQLVPGIKLRALHMQGMSSTTGAMSRTLGVEFYTHFIQSDP